MTKTKEQLVAAAKKEVDKGIDAYIKNFVAEMRRVLDARKKSGKK